VKEKRPRNLILDWPPGIEIPATTQSLDLSMHAGVLAEILQTVMATDRLTLHESHKVSSYHPAVFTVLN
jgi:hypothetical protein